MSWYLYNLLVTLPIIVCCDLIVSVVFPNANLETINTIISIISNIAFFAFFAICDYLSNATEEKQEFDYVDGENSDDEEYEEEYYEKYTGQAEGNDTESHDAYEDQEDDKTQSLEKENKTEQKAIELFSGYLDSQIALKKRYRELAQQYHPDHGGDEELFKSINVLYDKYTEESKKE